GRRVRDVLCVDELLAAFEAVRASQRNTAGQIYNVGGGPRNTVSLLELIEEINLITGRKLEYHLCRMRPGDQLVYVTNISNLQRDTGWTPRTSLQDTLQMMYAWWKRNQELFAPAAVAERTP